MDIAKIKALTRQMVGLVGGPKEAAQICGVSQVMISNWGDDKKPDRVIPIYRLFPLDAAAGNIFVKEWARSIADNQTSPESLLKTLAQFSKHTGDLEYTTLDAAEDGVLTPAEKRRIRDHIAPVKNIVTRLEAVIS